MLPATAPPADAGEVIEEFRSFNILCGDGLVVELVAPLAMTAPQLAALKRFIDLYGETAVPRPAQAAMGSAA